MLDLGSIYLIYNRMLTIELMITEGKKQKRQSHF
jgi:hypothetical protein